MKRLIGILLLAAVLALGYWLGRRSVEIVTSETVRIDTVFYEKPTPVSTSSRTVTVNVPRMLFAPTANISKNGDSSATDLSGNDDGSPDNDDGSPRNVGGSDSVQMRVALETREYGGRDTTFRAQVSGPAIGGYHPTLDWFEVYGRTVERVQTGTKRHRFAVTAGVGVGYTPKGLQPYIGLNAGVVLWEK